MAVLKINADFGTLFPDNAFVLSAHGALFKCPGGMLTTGDPAGAK